MTGVAVLQIFKVNKHTQLSVAALCQLGNTQLPCRSGNDLKQLINWYCYQ